MDGRATLEEVPAFICHRKVTSSAVSTSAAPLRNVALVGHQGNGKTTLAEAMLLHSGAVNRAGRVESGNTVLGGQPEERERHQSLTLGVASFEWKDVRFNLIDTPGYADFLADALAGLRTADVAVFVVDGVSGLAVNDELLWDAAEASACHACCSSTRWTRRTRPSTRHSPGSVSTSAPGSNPSSSR